MKNTKEKVSYCIGLETGRNLSQQFAEIDTEHLLNGLTDGLNKTSPKLPSQEIVQILTNLRNQMETQQKRYIAELAENNKKEGEVFLALNKEKQGIIALPSGLQYTILTQGSGAIPTLFDTVQVHYTGTFINGNTFDSSYQRGEPAVFPVNRVIAGWSEALQLMPIGSKWKIFIPHYLAYGEHGFGREIGPNTCLTFEMELLAINPS